MWQLVGVAATCWLFREMIRLWHHEDAVEWYGSRSLSPAEYQLAVLEEFSHDPVLQISMFNYQACAYRPEYGTFERPSPDSAPSMSRESYQQQKRDEFKDASTFLLRSPVFNALPIRSKMSVMDVLIMSMYDARGLRPVIRRKRRDKKPKPAGAISPKVSTEAQAIPSPVAVIPQLALSDHVRENPPSTSSIPASDQQSGTSSPKAENLVASIPAAESQQSAPATENQATGSTPVTADHQTLISSAETTNQGQSPVPEGGQ